MSVPKASFEHSPPTVWFEGDTLPRDTLRELFGVVGLNAYNIAIRRDEVMSMSDVDEDDGRIGFRLLPDNEATKAHGEAAVADFNQKLQEYHQVSPQTVAALVDRAGVRADRGY